MNYWINDFRPQLLDTLKEWDFLLINDSEARLLSGANNLKRAAAKIMEMGPSILVIKRGEYGALLFHRGRHFMVPGYLLEDVFDPTGAGDSFAGGFIGYLAGQGVTPSNGDIGFDELRRAVIYGSVMGSFCCEKFGVDRFRTLTRKEIEARFGLRPSRSDYNATVSTANGTIKAARTRIAMLEVGGMIVRDVDAMVLPDEALSENLLGLSFLSKLRRFEYANGRLVLEQ